MPAGDSQPAGERERTDKLDRCGSQQATASRREKEASRWKPAGGRWKPASDSQQARVDMLRWKPTGNSQLAGAGSQQAKVSRWKMDASRRQRAGEREQTS